jgi:GNAT superfamily N-acetyltransferase
MAAGKPTIGSVGADDALRAARFLAGGRRGNVYSESRAQAFLKLMRNKGADRAHLWWARRGRRCTAAALLLENPGRAGMLFHSPADAPGVDPGDLAALLREMWTAFLARGLLLVQALPLPDAAADVAALGAAGLVFLAELIYMRMELKPSPPAFQGGPCDPVEWVGYGEFAEQELAEVICETYRGSLDCPDLAGIRPVADVIAGHKATGQFRPESWWIVRCDGRAAGCIMVNRSASQNAGEVVYLGVVPSHRGRNLACRMLCHAAEHWHAAGAEALTLAVDARNAYALRAYRRAGLQETQRRLVYTATRRPPGAAPC